MADTSPIPVRLSKEVIRRLDATAEKLGNTRAGIIKLCLGSFLDAFESVGTASLPLDWQEILRQSDGRTRESRILGSSQSVCLQRDAPILPSDLVISDELGRVSPLTEIGPAKSQIPVSEDVHLASLEAQLPPGGAAMLVDMLAMEVANRGLRSQSIAEDAPPTTPAPRPPHASQPESRTRSTRKAKRATK